MKSRYDGNPGKESSVAKVRHERMESAHSEKNAFVKKQMAETASMGGRSPNLTGKAMEFNAYMCNNGEHAAEFAKKLTSDIDHKAFPVRQNVPMDEKE